MLTSTNRRATVLAAIVCAGLGAGVALAVQASASGGAAPVVPAGARPKPVAVPQAGPRTAKGALVPAVTATNAVCGETVTKSLKLNGDLDCESGDGLAVTGTKVVLNLNGFQISGGRDNETNGVDLQGVSDTVENGVVTEFGDGVRVDGPTATISAVRATINSVSGIDDFGQGTKITNSVMFGNDFEGLYSLDSGAIYTGDHELNNGDTGVTLAGGGSSGVTITSNVANGNSGWGIYDFDQGTTLTKNTADFNSLDGIYIDEVSAVDGGGNTAKGNDTAAGHAAIECYGVVCS